MTTKQKPQAAPGDPLLPHSREAEIAVLGSIILNNEAFCVAAELLRADDFFLPQHRVLFSVMLLMDRDGKPMDTVTIHEELVNRGQLSAAGGMTYLTKLPDGLPRSSNISQYCSIVKEKAGLRNLAFSAGAIQEQALGSGEPLSGVIERAATIISDIRHKSEAKEKAPVRMRDALDEATPMFERLYDGKHTIIGEPTGYTALDKITAGWIPADLVILGARPSMGKTALVLEYARRLAENGGGVLIFSLEMSRESLIQRLACTVGRVDSQKLRTGGCAPPELSRLTAAMARMREWPLWISDPPSMNSVEVVSKVRHYASRYKLRLVIVDYLQLLRSPRDRQSRQEEIAAVSRDLKEAAKALGKISGGTMLATAQLSRTGSSGEPKLEDLRESGQIEQDADVVMFLWNRDKKVKTGQADPFEKYLTIAKQRNGPIWKIGFEFLPQWTAFEESKAEDQIFDN